MPPNPNVHHQDLEGALESWLRAHWVPRSGGKALHQINVARPGKWPHDSRVPDLVLLTPERFAINKNEYFEGGPDVVVEIESPNDETWEKIIFYREVGVREVWVIHRDTKEPRVIRLDGGGQTNVEADVDGWVRSAATGIELRRSDESQLQIRLAEDPTFETSLPHRSGDCPQ